MAKFRDIQQDLESVFASPEWVATGIAAYPSTYDGPTGGGEFVRINIISGAGDVGGFSTYRVNGQLRLDLFVAGNDPDKRANEIADILDSILQGRTFTNGTQTRASFLANRGRDEASGSLTRYNYNLPFVYYS